MLNAFKHFQADRMDLDDLVALAAFGHLLRDQYEKQNIEVPDFVTDNLKAINREIQAKTAADREARRKTLILQRDALLTNKEKRDRIEKELKELETA